VGRIDSRLIRLEREAATNPQEHERAIDREAFRRMSTADLVTFERTFQRVEDMGEELTEEEQVSFEAAYERYRELFEQVRSDPAR
jgi:phosphoglycolate phosphatase-like HAD superfamily hydrolase